MISSSEPDAQLAKGGPCLNFAHFSMQFCNPGDPKGGPWPNGLPPKYAPNFTHLALLFERLRQYGIILNKDKCVFCSSKIEFLGHEVSKEGVRPLQGKVEAIRSFPQPKTTKQLRRFLGMINFYRRFVPNAARTLQPLEQLQWCKVTKYFYLSRLLK